MFIAFVLLMLLVFFVAFACSLSRELQSRGLPFPSCGCVLLLATLFVVWDRSPELCFTGMSKGPGWIFPSVCNFLGHLGKVPQDTEDMGRPFV